MKAIYRGKLYWAGDAFHDYILLEDDMGDWTSAPLSDPTLVIDPTDGDLESIDIEQELP